MINPKVYRVSFEDDRHHRVATCGGFDSDYSHTTRETMSELVVAPDFETAQFLWHHRGRLITSRTKVAWEEIGPVSLMFASGYGV